MRWRSCVRRAWERVSAEIAASTDQTRLYSRGLASEGYLGGYRDALSDMLLVLDDTPLSGGSRRWWSENGE